MQLNYQLNELKVPELSFLKEHLALFLVEKLNWRKSTRKIAKSILSRYVIYLGQHYAEPLIKATSDFVTAFPSDSSKRLALSFIRAFWSNVYSRDLNPGFVINLPKVQRTAGVRFFTGPEIEILLTYLEANKHLHFRERAAVITLIFSGMRAGELLNLRHGDISAEGLVTIRETKSGRSRKITIPHIALKAIEEYHKAFKSDGPFVFYPHDKPNQNLSYSALWRAVKKIYIKANLKSVGLHVFRHSFAMALTQSRVDVDFLQKLLGHSQISTTQLYRQLYDDEVIRRASETESAVFNYYSTKRRKK